MTKGAGKALGSRLLALVPVFVGALTFALAVPRAVPPDEVPLPAPDLRELTKTEVDDDLRVERATATPLASSVLALGSAIRNLLAAQTRAVTPTELAELRRAVDRTRSGAVTDAGAGALLALRAVQSARFRRAVADWQTTHVESDDLAATGGNFVFRMQSTGWTTDGRIAFGDEVLRAAYKLLWNAVAGVEGEETFALTLDEERALAAFSIAHPHAPEPDRRRIAERRAHADDQECARLDEEEGMAKERWRIEKIRQFAAKDPTYPEKYALGVAYFRAKNPLASVEAFRDYVRVHPDGPLALRAQNHLRAAIRVASIR